MHLLQQLAHANQGRSQQLEQWQRLLPQLHWLVDQSPGLADLDSPGHWYRPDASLWTKTSAGQQLQQRLIWLPDPELEANRAAFQAEFDDLVRPVGGKESSTDGQPLQLNRASGPRDIPMAICQAVADVHGVPVYKDSLRDQIDGLLERQPSLNLYNIGQLLTGLDLSVALIQMPLPQLARIPTPAVIEHQGSLALIDGIDPDGRLRLLEPELGPLRLLASDLLPEGQERLPLLLIRRRPGSKEKRFSWSWYGPYLLPHRQELIQVLACSAVLSVLGIVIGLGIFRMIQAIGGGTDAIDGVISVGVILIVACVLEAIVSALRSLIFTGIANRVDMDTRETILDRLVRLPQGFFDERPVGRITYYFNQLDRLRDFLISKALTSILDFGFSFLYLAVLWWISPTLTLITLSALPLFVVLAFIANPLVDQQIDRTMEEGVKTNSYLTEAITGIQTIKSQNAELKTRWEFQTRYASFIGEDYKLKVSGQTIQALAKFINELSSIAQMVVGIYLINSRRSEHRSPVRIPDHGQQGHRPDDPAGADLAGVQSSVQQPHPGRRYRRSPHRTVRAPGHQHPDAAHRRPCLDSGCGLPLQRGRTPDSQQCGDGGAGGHLRGHGGRLRIGKIHNAQAAITLLRARERPHLDRRPRYRQGGALFPASSDRRGPPGFTAVRRHDQGQPADGEAGCQQPRADPCRQDRLRPRLHHGACPRATTPRSASGVQDSPAAKANAWPWPAPCSRTPRMSSWMKPPVPSMPAPSVRCASTCSTPSAVAPFSSSPTASPPCGRRT